MSVFSEAGATWGALTAAVGLSDFVVVAALVVGIPTGAYLVLWMWDHFTYGNGLDVFARRKEYVASYRMKRRHAINRFFARWWWTSIRACGGDARTWYETLGWVLFWFFAALVVISPALQPAIANAVNSEFSWGQFFREALANLNVGGLVATLVIGALQTYVLVFRKGVGRGRLRELKEEAADHAKSTLGNLLDRITEKLPTDSLDKVTVITNVLQIVVSEMRLIYKKFDPNYFRSTVLIFEGGGPRDIAIVARDAADRKINIRFSAKDSLAYFTALSGKAFVEPNILDGRHPFPVKGIETEIPRYASILLIPIMDIDPKTRVRKVWGVLTIDCKHRYFFSAKVRDRLSKKLYPYTKLLLVFLKGLPAAQPVEAVS